MGLLAAILAFQLSAPFEHTLVRSAGTENDPSSLFTYGTAWGAVNRIAFGALICGTFSLILTLGRRSVLRSILAGVLGTAIGGLVNYVTDSGADIIGIIVANQNPQLGGLVAMIAWCAFVPIGIALAVTISIGFTRERMRRAVYAARLATIASFVIQIIGGVTSSPDPTSQNVMLSQIPVWRLVEIAVGVTLGISILVADEWIRVASLRRMHGRNEFRDWSIDHPVTRIGSAEGCEVPIFGMMDVAPIHAEIVQQSGQFLLVAHRQTLVNGLPVTQHALASSDHISIGQAEFVFTVRQTSPGVTFMPTRSQGPQMPTVHGQPTQLISVHVLADSFGQTVPLVPGRYGVGTDRTNAICLYTDTTVAPKHAVIIVSDQGIELVDLGGGTQVNGSPISGLVTLKLGDTVQFGTTNFTVRS